MRNRQEELKSKSDQVPPYIINTAVMKSIEGLHEAEEARHNECLKTLDNILSASRNEKHSTSPKRNISKNIARERQPSTLSSFIQSVKAESQTSKDTKRMREYNEHI